MKYTLMNKNTPILDLKFDMKGQYISEICSTYNPEFAPLGLVGSKEEIDLDDLNDWWEDRCVSDSRHNVETILELLQKDRYELIIRSMGLSLADQYWIQPENEDLDWEDVNFFTNGLSDEMGKLFFNKAKSTTDTLNYSSPDWTLNGTLEKRWKSRKGEILLCKKGSEPFYQQPYNEVIASKILKKLGCDNFVKYTLGGSKEAPYCICKSFIDENTEYIPASVLKKITKKQPKETEWEYFLRACKILGIESLMQKYLDYVLPFDYLIGNVDRNYGNFGVIRNVETLDVIGVAPIFDNGNSLWYNDVLLSQDVKAYPFFFQQEEQIQCVKDKAIFPIERIGGILAECLAPLKKSIRCDERRFENIAKGLERRSKMLLESSYK